MAEYRGYVGLDVHKDTIAAAVAWPGRADPEYRGFLPNQSSPRAGDLAQIAALPSAIRTEFLARGGSR